MIFFETQTSRNRLMKYDGRELQSSHEGRRVARLRGRAHSGTNKTFIRANRDAGCREKFRVELRCNIC
jgi:hypothetical protein